MRILFIRGFNTDQSHPKTSVSGKYNNFDKQLKYDITYFNYGTSEHIKDIFERLKTKMSDKYDVIIAHSMGGCLLTKYLQLNPNKCFAKIIMIAPLLVKKRTTKILVKPSFMKYFTLPKMFVSDNPDTTYSDWVSLKHVHQIYKKKYAFFLDEEVLVQTINNYSSLFIIYSKEEETTQIPSTILEKFKNVIYVDGRHCAFEQEEHKDVFFDVLLKLIHA